MEVYNLFLMEKTTTYNGKFLRFFYNEGESVRFNTEDFFNILGVNPDYYVTDNERDFINYPVAIIHAERIDQIFAQWLQDNYEDFGN